MTTASRVAVWLAADALATRLPLAIAPSGPTGLSNQTPPRAAQAALREAACVARALAPRSAPCVIPARPARAVLSVLRPALQWRVLRTLLPALSTPPVSFRNIPRALFLIDPAVPEPQHTPTEPIPNNKDSNSTNGNDSYCGADPTLVDIRRCGTDTQLILPKVLITTTREDHVAALVVRALAPPHATPFWIHIGAAELAVPSTLNIALAAVRSALLPRSAHRPVSSATSTTLPFYDVLITDPAEPSLVYVPHKYRNRILLRDVPFSSLSRDVLDTLRRNITPQNTITKSVTTTPSPSNKTEDVYDITMLIATMPSLRFQWDKRRTDGLLNDATALLNDPQVRRITVVVDETACDAETITIVRRWTEQIHSSYNNLNDRTTRVVVIDNTSSLLNDDNNNDNYQDNTSTLSVVFLGSNGASTTRDELIYETAIARASHIVVACGESGKWMLTEAIASKTPTYLAGFKATRGSLRKEMKMLLTRRCVRLFAPSPYAVDSIETMGDMNGKEDDSNSNGTPGIAGFLSSSTRQHDKLSFLNSVNEHRTHAQVADSTAADTASWIRKQTIDVGERVRQMYEEHCRNRHRNSSNRADRSS